MIINNKTFVQIYTGDGKGKTTAGLGLAIRALGWGKRVGIIYFDKGGDEYGERKVLDGLQISPLRPSLALGTSVEMTSGRISYRAFGLDRRDKATGKFRFGVTPEDIAEGSKGLALASEWVSSGLYDLVVLDEINTSASLGIVKVQDVLELLSKRSLNTEVVLTGRNCPPEFIQVADLVTEMKMVKHYFDKGQPTREGIEY